MVELDQVVFEVGPKAQEFVGSLYDPPHRDKA